jgi:hypothetical protein
MKDAAAAAAAAAEANNSLLVGFLDHGYHCTAAA